MWGLTRRTGEEFRRAIRRNAREFYSVPQIVPIELKPIRRAKNICIVGYLIIVRIRLRTEMKRVAVAGDANWLVPPLELIWGLRNAPTSPLSSRNTCK